MNKEEEKKYSHHYVLKYCRPLLKIFGVWPMVVGFQSRFEKFRTLFLVLLSSFLMCFSIIPMGHYLCVGMKGIQNKDKIKVLGPLMYCCIWSSKYYFMIMRSSVIGKCVMQMEKDWKFVNSTKHRAEMMGPINFGHKVTFICASLHYFFDMSYALILPFMTNSFMIANSTVRALVYPGIDHFVKTPYVSPHYEMIYLAQLVYGFQTVTNEAGLLAVVAALVAHAVGMFKIQIAMLRELIDEGEKGHGKRQKLLATIVASHVDTLQYSANASKALQELCFMEVVGSTSVICALEYLCIVEWSNHDNIATGTYFVNIISLGFNILVICYVGESLVEEAEKVGEVAYEIEWYRLSKRKAVDLVLPIAMAKFPPKLTGGKIFEISMASFSTILKSTVVYMQLCQAIMEW